MQNSGDRSRAALLTGRYQTRSGVYPGVFYPGSKGGLPLNETTIAEVLKPLGYATAMVGKWHLGIGANGSFLPVYQGFDHYLGVPYSHDQHTHYPQFASALTAGKSLHGRFGDALMEFDTSVGAILEALEASGIQNNTFVFFTSDNGPELLRMSRGGNAGLLKCGKGTTYEGGMREPAIAYWPGRIQPGVTHELGSTLDLLPTIAALAQAKLPSAQLDGYDMSTILFTSQSSMRKTMFYYPVDPSIKLGVFAVRYGKYKAHYYTRGSSHSETTPDHDCHITAGLQAHDPPLLFDLESDPSENYNLMVYDYQPEYDLVLKKIQELKAQFEETMVFGESQIGKGSDHSLEPCCNPQCSPKPACCACFSLKSKTERELSLPNSKK
ncbi:UNVERIFIED_CONTAM: hypothetical protein FKN15_052695 [Acipenser sinensis]